MKRCNCCGAEWGAERFNTLPLVNGKGEAVQGGYLMKLRQCTCSSTLYVEVLDLEALPYVLEAA